MSYIRKKIKFIFNKMFDLNIHLSLKSKVVSEPEMYEGTVQPTKSIGDGVKFYCDNCEYKGKIQNLKIHAKKYKHMYHTFGVIEGKAFKKKNLLPKKIIPLFKQKPKIITVSFA